MNVLLNPTDEEQSLLEARALDAVKSLDALEDALSDPFNAGHWGEAHVRDAWRVFCRDQRRFKRFYDYYNHRSVGWHHSPAIARALLPNVWEKYQVWLSENGKVREAAARK